MAAKLDIPSFEPPIGPSTKIRIPPQWFTVVTAVSRKDYNQMVQIKQTNPALGVSGTTTTDHLMSTWGLFNDTMKHKRTGNDSFVIAALPNETHIEVSFFWSKTKTQRDPNELVGKNAKSKQAQVLEVVKPANLPDIFPDYHTFLVFADDGLNTGPGASIPTFNDMVAVIHLTRIDGQPKTPSSTSAPVSLANPSETKPKVPVHPALEKKRPDNIEEYLLNYETLFVVDDARSMAGARWTEARDTLVDLATRANKIANADGIRLTFITSAEIARYVKDSSTVKHYFKHVKPRATTKACGSKLQSLLEEHIEKLEEFKKEAEGITDPHELNELEPMEPLDIVVLSDGSFSDDPTPAIKEAAKALQSKKFPDRSINVFFVQIGNDNGVGQAFKGIEKNAKSSGVASIVNVALTEGPLSEVFLIKVLTGTK